MAISEVLLIGGAAGVGKTSVGWEVSVQLSRLGVAHWHLEGDVLDAAWPRPADDQDGEQAVWLEAQAPTWVSRLATDGEKVPALAGAVIDHSGWTR